MTILNNSHFTTHATNMKNNKLKKKHKAFGKSDKFDVNGSYTGTSLIDDTPIQDADDL